MRSTFFPRLVNGPFGDPLLYVRLAHRRRALLFDCGDLGALTTRDLLKVREVFVSHAHIDHLIGFDALLRLFLYQDARLTVYGPEGMADRIRAHLAGYTWNLLEDFPLELTVREWSPEGGRELGFRACRAFVPEERNPWRAEDGVLADGGHYRVRAFPLDHGGIVSLGFVLQEPLHVAIHKDALEELALRPGPWLTEFKDLVRAGQGESFLQVPKVDGGVGEWTVAALAARIAHVEPGMKLCYATDAAPTEANQERIAEEARGSHLLVVEATFLHEDLALARERNHLTARQAGEMARRAGAARLLTFHHSPRYQDRPHLLAEEAERAFRGT